MDRQAELKSKYVVSPRARSFFQRTWVPHCQPVRFDILQRARQSKNIV